MRRQLILIVVMLMTALGRSGVSSVNGAAPGFLEQPALSVGERPGLSSVEAIAGGSAQMTRTPLTLALEAELAQFPARTSIYLKHLKTGEEVGIRADDSFNSQSVIKVPIMVRAFQLAEAGRLKLDERITLTRADLRDGTGVFQFADLGLAPTVRDLILQMIITSDNTATDQMTTKVGGVDGLNSWLAKAGYKMRMLNRGYEYRRKLLARLDPQLAEITAEETTGLQYAMSENPLFEHYRPLFVGTRAKWLQVVQDPVNRQTHAGEPAETDGRGPKLLARRHQRARDRPHARGHRVGNDRFVCELEHDAALPAAAACGVTPASPLPRRPRGSQDRR